MRPNHITSSTQTVHKNSKSYKWKLSSCAEHALRAGSLLFYCAAEYFHWGSFPAVVCIQKWEEAVCLIHPVPQSDYYAEPECKLCNLNKQSSSVTEKKTGGMNVHSFIMSLYLGLCCIVASLGWYFTLKCQSKQFVMKIFPGALLL